MAAVCIFCGEEPESKTKEHVFPQWLLKMTGFHSENVSVGTNWSTGKEIIFPGKNYTFPACDTCNNSFSHLEANAKAIVEHLCDDADVTGGELELLLNWFDKIRIGAWLGNLTLNSNTLGITPNHYIADRVGVKDRYLSITNTYLPEKTLKWSGANTLTFMSSPTALMVRINNLVFVTASTDFLVSRSVGFPYPEFEIQPPESRITHFKLLTGTGNTKSDCFLTRPYAPSHTIRQPIFQNALNTLPELYDNSYVSENSYDPHGGIGKIFLQNNQTTRTLERDDRVNFKMESAKSIYGRVQVVRPILELQLDMLKSRMKRLRFTSESERRKQFAAAKIMIQYTQEQIKQYSY